ncbi:MAG: MFS transporter [Steroidobacteraceae bacterium]
MREVSFAALRHPGFRVYFLCSAAAMMADSIEHVISYWVLFQKFRSPALGGFAVISHWLPFLLFSVPMGAIADHRDPRRLIQFGMLLFMGVSLAWGTLFFTDTLQVWHAWVLLIIHGCAGVFWGPPSQLLIHYIVGTQQLQSAVRLNATSRNLGLLLGPAVGGAIMLLLGPSLGFFVNALIYLPLLAWLWRAPYGPAFQPPSEAAANPRPAMRGLREIIATVRDIAGNRTIVTMTLLGGGASLLIGNAYQAQMPGYAHDLGHGSVDMSYSILLAADAAGALLAGIALETRGLLQAKPRTACILALLWCVALGSFAMVRNYPLALGLLLAAGFLELSYNSMAQTLVQMAAPAQMRGRVIGLFSMASQGLKTFSGMSVGIVGGLIGIHASLGLSAAVLGTLILALLFFSRARVAGSSA